MNATAAATGAKLRKASSSGSHLRPACVTRVPRVLLPSMLRQYSLANRRHTESTTSAFHPCPEQAKKERLITLDELALHNGTVPGRPIWLGICGEARFQSCAASRHIPQPLASWAPATASPREPSFNRPAPAFNPAGSHHPWWHHPTQVFDVTRAPQYYAHPDGGYAFFSGRDGSKAFITGEFNETGAPAPADSTADAPRPKPRTARRGPGLAPPSVLILRVSPARRGTACSAGLTDDLTGLDANHMLALVEWTARR